MRKNTSRNVRRAIVQSLSSGEGGSNTRIGSVKLNPAKVERWRKEQVMMGGLQIPLSGHGVEGKASQPLDIQELT